MNKEMYLIRFRPYGYNYVYATSLEEAKALLLDQLGPKLYNEINWKLLLVGKEAEAQEKIEASYCYD